MIAVPLTCAFGSRWTKKGCGPCKKCRDATAKACRNFDLDVLLGVYTDRGYTPQEWAVKVAKDAAQGRVFAEVA